MLPRAHRLWPAGPWCSGVRAEGLAWLPARRRLLLAPLAKHAGPSSSAGKSTGPCWTLRVYPEADGLIPLYHCQILPLPTRGPLLQTAYERFPSREKLVHLQALECSRPKGLYTKTDLHDHTALKHLMQINTHSQIPIRKAFYFYSF